MVTEILGLLILVGAILVFGARYWSGRQVRPQDMKSLQEDMRQSTQRLKKELERSGDAVVNRLESHVSRLEELIREADAKNAQLDAKLSEARRLEVQFQQGLEELERSVAEARAEAQRFRERQYEPERVDANDFASVLQNSLQKDYSRTQAQAAQPEPAGQSMIGEPLSQPPAEGEPLVNAQQAAGLAQAMNQRETEPESREEPPIEPAPMDQVKAMEPEPEPEQEPELQMRRGPLPDTTAAKARAMLLSGYSVEDIARETGLGRRAVELVKEMSKDDLEKKAL